MTREEAIVLIERSVNELKEMMQTITMPTSAAEQLQQEIDAHEIAISALRQQEHFREVTKKVEPLTLDELRQMDGEPVWVQSPGIPEYGRWAIVEGVGENSLFLHDDFTCHDYGKTWLAFRQKPEEGTV